MNNHDGTFREEALLRGVALSGDGKEMAGMGVGIGDYDCDGRLDIVRTHYMNQATGLYRNHRQGRFRRRHRRRRAHPRATLRQLGHGPASISTTTATPTSFWSPARSIPNSKPSFPNIRAEAHALSFAIWATEPSYRAPMTTQPALDCAPRQPRLRLRRLRQRRRPRHSHHESE